MTFPKRIKGESSGSVGQSPTSSVDPTSTLKQQKICNLKSLKESNSDKCEASTKYSSSFESESLAPWQQTQCSVKTISWYESFFLICILIFGKRHTG